MSSDKVINIISAYPDISLEWLMTGQGPMLRDAPATPKVIYEPPRSPGLVVSDVGPVDLSPPQTGRPAGRQKIPVYDMEAVEGLVALFADRSGQRVVDVVETGSIPRCDGGLRITGDSMYPLLKSGDMVFYRQINDIVDNIIWGEMYLVSFDMDGEEYVTVKYIQKSEITDHITLVSYNQYHKPFDIHLSRIRALAFIKASLRINSVK